MLVNKVKTIFFDFDGVLVDSNKLKAENIKLAHFEVLQKNNDEFLNYFSNNPGISRELKVLKFYNEETSNKILKKYSELNSKNYTSLNLIEDSWIFLKSIPKSVECIIVSGGDKEEINTILKNNEIDQFKFILDGKKSKIDHLAACDLTDSIFIGDAIADYDAAIQHSLRFFFLETYSDDNAREEIKKLKLLNDSSVTVLKKLTELQIKEVYHD